MTTATPDPDEWYVRGAEDFLKVTEQAESPAPETAQDTLTDKVKRYIALYDALKAAEAEHDSIKAEYAALEAELLDAYTEAETRSMTVRGRTVFMARTVYAQWQAGLEPEQKQAALEAAGHGHLITRTINGNTLSAFVREYDSAEKPLPDELSGVLDVGEKFNIRVRKA